MTTPAPSSAPDPGEPAATTAVPPVDPLSDALQVLLLAHTRAQAALALRLGAGRSDVDALEHLMVGPLGPGELAGRLGLTPGAVTQMVTRFERRGHARRTPDPADGRRSLVELTDQGRATVHEHVWPMLMALDDLARAIEGGEADAPQAVLTYLTGAARALGELAES